MMFPFRSRVCALSNSSRVEAVVARGGDKGCLGGLLKKEKRALVVVIKEEGEVGGEDEEDNAFPPLPAPVPAPSFTPTTTGDSAPVPLLVVFLLTPEVVIAVVVVGVVDRL